MNNDIVRYFDTANSIKVDINNSRMANVQYARA